MSETYDYASKNLTSHLLEAEEYRTLLSLVRERLWFDKQIKFDSSRRVYAADIENALKAAKKLLQNGLNDFVFCALIYAFLGSIARNIDTEALVLMVLLGREEQVQSYFSLYSDPVKQVEGAVRLSEVYNKINSASAESRLQSGIDIATSLENGNVRDHCFDVIVQGLCTLGLYNKAFHWHDSIRNEDRRQRALIRILASMAEVGKFKEALNRMTEIHQPYLAISFLADIIHQARKQNYLQPIEDAQQQLLKHFKAFKPSPSTPEVNAIVLRSLYLAGEITLGSVFAQNYVDVTWIGHALRWLIREGKIELADELWHELPSSLAENIPLTDQLFIDAWNNRLDIALSKAHLVQKPKPRAGGYGALAVIAAEKGHLDIALELLPAIEQANIRTWVLAKIGQILVTRNDFSGAENMLEMLLHEAQQVELEVVEAVMQDTIQQLASTGNMTHIKSLVGNTISQPDLFERAIKKMILDLEFEEALRHIHLIQSDVSRAQFYMDLIYAVCEQRELQIALFFLKQIPQEALAQTSIYVARLAMKQGQLTECLQVISAIPHSGAKDDAYREMVILLIRKHDFKMAENLIRKIQMQSIQQAAIAELAVGYAESGELEYALNMLQPLPPNLHSATFARLAPLMNSREDIQLCLDRCSLREDYRKAIVAIASALARKNRYADAKEYILTLSPRDQQNAKIGILRSLINTYGKNIDLESLLQLTDLSIEQAATTIITALLDIKEFNEVLRFIPLLSNPKIRFKTLVRVATELAAQGDLGRAIQLLMDNLNDTNNSPALMKVSEYMAHQGQFSDALKVTGSIQSEIYRKKAWALVASQIVYMPRLEHVYQVFEIARLKGVKDVLNAVAAFSPVLIALTGFEEFSQGLLPLINSISDLLGTRTDGSLLIN